MKIKSKFSPSQEKQEMAPYLGKAGEHLVLSEMLLRKFDAALIEVDSGIDLLAEKAGKLFKIQVKTRSLGANKQAAFVLSRKALERIAVPDFVVLIIIGDEVRESFVFSLKVIRQMIDDKVLGYVGKQDWYRAEIIYRDNQWFIKNRKLSLDEYRGNYSVIK